MSYYILNFDKLKKYNIKYKQKLLSVNFKNYKIITDFMSILEISRAIEKYNLYYKLKPNDVVFYLGAYHGLYSIFAISAQKT